MMVVFTVSIVVRLIAAMMKSDISDATQFLDKVIEDNEFWETVAKSGMEYLLFSLLGVLTVWLFMRKKVSFAQLFGKCQPMNVHSFFKCAIIFMGIQLPNNLLYIVLELGLNQFGYTAAGGKMIASSAGLTIMMFFYVSLIGPIVEELIYRGFVMRSLEKYGRSFAIVVSSVFFGIMHQKPVQSVFAMFAGLVLGYVAMNYSIRWSIFLHIINNCLFSQVLTQMIKELPQSMQACILWGIILVFFMLAVFVLIKERKQVKEKVGLCLENKKYYLYTITSVWFLLFFFASIIVSMMGIEKI